MVQSVVSPINEVAEDPYKYLNTVNMYSLVFVFYVFVYVFFITNFFLFDYLFYLYLKWKELPPEHFMDAKLKCVFEMPEGQREEAPTAVKALKTEAVLPLKVKNEEKVNRFLNYILILVNN